MIVSHDIYIGFVSLMVLGIGFWAIRDFFFLRRVLREEGEDPAVRRDKIFGAIIGMVLAVVGLVGLVRYHWDL